MALPTDWSILLLDGILLSGDQMAIVAVGIDAAGDKQVLDFELASTESTKACRCLMRRLMKRGFHCDRRLLSVLGYKKGVRVQKRGQEPNWYFRQTCVDVRDFVGLTPSQAF
jgi:transposase-like protein